MCTSEVMGHYAGNTRRKRGNNVHSLKLGPCFSNGVKAKDLITRRLEHKISFRLPTVNKIKERNKHSVVIKKYKSLNQTLRGYYLHWRFKAFAIGVPSRLVS